MRFKVFGAASSESSVSRCCREAGMQDDEEGWWKQDFLISGHCRAAFVLPQTKFSHHFRPRQMNPRYLELNFCCVILIPLCIIFVIITSLKGGIG